MALIIFYYFYKTTDNLILARSIAFATLGVNSLIYVFSIRTLTKPFWVENPLKNKWLNISVIAGVILQVLPFLTDGMRRFFSVTKLSVTNWLVVFSLSFIMFIIIEVTKAIFREKLETAN